MFRVKGRGEGETLRELGILGSKWQRGETTKASLYAKLTNIFINT